MSTLKNAGIVGLAALAIALMIYSFYLSFYSGPQPQTPEQGQIMGAKMREGYAAQKAAMEKSRSAPEHSASPEAESPAKGK